MRRPLNFRPVGIPLGMIGTQVLSAQQTPLKVALLLQTDVVGMEGKEVVVQFSEFAPRATSGKHSHPGHEVAYVLEGSGVIRIGDEERVENKGSVFFCPRGCVHRVSGGPEGTKFLEIAFGEFDEKDIERLEDLYGRS